MYTAINKGNSIPADVNNQILDSSSFEETTTPLKRSNKDLKEEEADKPSVKQNEYIMDSSTTRVTNDKKGISTTTESLDDKDTVVENTDKKDGAKKGTFDGAPSQKNTQNTTNLPIESIKEVLNDLKPIIKKSKNKNKQTLKGQVNYSNEPSENFNNENSDSTMEQTRNKVNSNNSNNLNNLNNSNSCKQVGKALKNEINSTDILKIEQMFKDFHRKIILDVDEIITDKLNLFSEKISYEQSICNKIIDETICPRLEDLINEMRIQTMNEVKDLRKSFVSYGNGLIASNGGNINGFGSGSKIFNNKILNPGEIINELSIMKKTDFICALNHLNNNNPDFYEKFSASYIIILLKKIILINRSNEVGETISIALYNLLFELSVDKISDDFLGIFHSIFLKLEVMVYNDCVPDLKSLISILNQKIYKRFSKLTNFDFDSTVIATDGKKNRK